ncbi:hypothetical protein GRZ57_06810 [Sphaerochaeta halotolerans]|nr:hypothetical protein [Sphaerochaeta halotolerans]
MQEPDYELFFTEQRGEENMLFFTVLDQEGSISCEDRLYSQLHETATAFPIDRGYFYRKVG